MKTQSLGVFLTAIVVVGGLQGMDPFKGNKSCDPKSNSMSNSYVPYVYTNPSLLGLPPSLAPSQNNGGKSAPQKLVESAKRKQQRRGTLEANIFLIKKGSFKWSDAYDELKQQMCEEAEEFGLLQKLTDAIDSQLTAIIKRQTKTD